MHVRCEHCHAGYTLPAEKLTPGRRVQFNCRHCSQRIVVQVPAAEPVAEAPTPAADEVRWFVAAADGSYRKLADSELERAIAAGEIDAQQLIWSKGFDEWLPVSETARWRERFGAVDAPAPADATSHDARPVSEPAAADQVPRRVRRTTEVGLGEAAATGSEPLGEPIHRAAAQPEPEATQLADALSPEPEDVTREQAVAGGDDDDGLGQSTIAGVGSSDASQAAVSLPIVRAAPPPGRADSGLHRVRPRLSPRGAARRSGLQESRPSPAVQQPVADAHSAHGHAQPHPAAHPGSAEGDLAWAPATDTYIGPRDNFTRRLGSAAERDALIAQVEAGRRHRSEIQRWQAVTIAACGVAFLALLLAAWAMLDRRAATAALHACQHPPSTQAAVAVP